MHDNEFKTKENKIQTKDKIEPQHIYMHFLSMVTKSKCGWTSLYDHLFS